MENEYPGNSRRQRKRDDDDDPQTIKKDKEEKVVEKVVSGRVRRRKRPIGKRWAEAFFGVEEGESTWEWVWFDRVLPGIRELLFDAAFDGAERRLFGGSRRSRGGRGYSDRRPDYGSRFRGGGRDRDRDEPRQLSRRARARHDFGEMIFETRVEAEEVLDRMYDIVAKFDIVTVADLLELSGYETTHVDRRHGWDDIRGSDVIRLRSGDYLLELPPASPIE